MRKVILAFAMAGAALVCAAAAQGAPPDLPSPFLDDPWREAYRKASPVQRARMLLAKPEWDENLRGDAAVMLFNDPEGRDVLLQATLEASACSRVTSSVSYMRASLKKDTAAGEHYWFELTYTDEVIGKLRTAATMHGACAATTAEIGALAGDRAAWAKTRPAQQKPPVRTISPAAPRAGMAGSSPCPPGPVNPTMRVLCDPATVEANSQVNGKVYGRASAVRDACFKALEAEMKRTNNRVPNFAARYETCRRIK